jgi:hypothetical protein
MKLMSVMAFIAVTLALNELAVGQVRTAATAINVPVVLSDSTATQTIYFGLDSRATDTLDAVLGESELPPLPPSEVFDVRFVGTDIGVDIGLGSLRDYRNGDGTTRGTRVHEIGFQVAPGRKLFLSWSFPVGVKATVQDLILGNLVQFTMEGIGSYTLSNASLFGKLKMTVQYTASVDVPESEPREFNLLQNFPNPFNPATVIPFYLASPAQVKLDVFDAPGRTIARLLDERRDAGYQYVVFDASGLASGVYFYRLSAGDISAVRRLTLLR